MSRYDDLPAGFAVEEAVQEPAFSDVPEGFAVEQAAFSDVPAGFEVEKEEPTFSDLPPGFAVAEEPRKPVALPSPVAEEPRKPVELPSPVAEGAREAVRQGRLTAEALPRGLVAGTIQLGSAAPGTMEQLYDQEANDLEQRRNTLQKQVRFAEQRQAEGLAGTERAESPTAWEMTRAALTGSAVSDLPSFRERVAAQEKRPVSEADRQELERMRGELAQLDAEAEKKLPEWKQKAEGWRGIRQEMEAQTNRGWLKAPEGENAAAWILRTIGQAGPSVGAGYLATPVSPWAGAALLGHVQGVGQYVRAREAGVPAAEAQRLYATEALLATLIEHLPLERVTKLEGPRIWRAIQQGGTEGAEEVIDQIKSNMLQAEYVKDQKMYDGLFESFVGGFGAGAVGGAVMPGEQTTEDGGQPGAQPGPASMEAQGDVGLPSPGAEAPPSPAGGRGSGMGEGVTVEDATKPEPPETTTAMWNVPTVEVPLDKITHTPDVPNFKEAADEKTGVVRGQQLSGKYNRLGTAPIVLWERLNGDLNTMTGRHREDLARRNGEKTIPAQIVKEADGFTKEMALTFDAESNIRDGQGEVKDYAHYFRNATGVTRQAAEERGLLSRAKGRAGWILGKNASDDLYALYKTGRYTKADGTEIEGKISEAKALALAEAAPGRPELQAVGIKYALSEEAPGADDLRNFMEALQAQPEATEKQLDLLGFDWGPVQESIKMAKAATKIQNEVAHERNVLKAGAKLSDPRWQEVARKYRLKGGDATEIARQIAELDAKADAWKRWRQDPEKMAQVRQAAGLEVKAAAAAAASIEAQGDVGQPSPQPSPAGGRGSDIELAKAAERAGVPVEELEKDLAWAQESARAGRAASAEQAQNVRNDPLARLNRQYEEWVTGLGQEQADRLYQARLAELRAASVIDEDVALRREADGAWVMETADGPVSLDEGNPEHKAFIEAVRTNTDDETASARAELENAAAALPGARVVVLDDPGQMDLFGGMGSRAPSGRIEGMWHNGVAYVFARNVRPGQAERVVVHEAVVHGGLRAVVGDKLNDVLAGSYLAGKTYETELNRVAKDRKLDLADPAKRSEALEELAADIWSRRKATPSVWKRLVFQVRAALRAAGLKLEFSESDFENLMSQAFEKARGKGQGAKGSGQRFSVAGTPGIVGKGTKENKSAEVAPGAPTVESGTKPSSGTDASAFQSTPPEGGDANTEAQMARESQAELQRGGTAKPVVVYQGTLSDTFHATRGGLRWFASKYEAAEPYSVERDKTGKALPSGKRGRVVSATLDMRNPLDLRKYGDAETPTKIKDILARIGETPESYFQIAKNARQKITEAEQHLSTEEKQAIAQEVEKLGTGMAGLLADGLAVASGQSVLNDQWRAQYPAVREAGLELKYEDVPSWTGKLETAAVWYGKDGRKVNLFGSDYGDMRSATREERLAYAEAGEHAGYIIAYKNALQTLKSVEQHGEETDIPYEYYRELGPSLRAHGYDGLIVQEQGQTSYAVLDDAQVRKIEGEKGQRFSVATPRNAKIEDAREKLKQANTFRERIRTDLFKQAGLNPITDPEKILQIRKAFLADKLLLDTGMPPKGHRGEAFDRGEASPHRPATARRYLTPLEWFDQKYTEPMEQVGKRLDILSSYPYRFDESPEYVRLVEKVTGIAMPEYAETQSEIDPEQLKDAEGRRMAFRATESAWIDSVNEWLAQRAQERKEFQGFALGGGLRPSPASLYRTDSPTRYIVEISQQTRESEDAGTYMSDDQYYTTTGPADAHMLDIVYRVWQTMQETAPRLVDETQTLRDAERQLRNEIERETDAIADAAQFIGKGRIEHATVWTGTGQLFSTEEEARDRAFDKSKVHAVTDWILFNKHGVPLDVIIGAKDKTTAKRIAYRRFGTLAFTPSAAAVPGAEGAKTDKGLALYSAGPSKASLLAQARKIAGEKGQKVHKFGERVAKSSEVDAAQAEQVLDRSKYDPQSIRERQDAQKRMSDAELLASLATAPVEPSLANFGVLDGMEYIQRKAGVMNDMTRTEAERKAAEAEFLTGVERLNKAGMTAGQMLRQFAELKWKVPEVLLSVIEKQLAGAGRVLTQQQKLKLTGLIGADFAARDALRAADEKMGQTLADADIEAFDQARVLADQVNAKLLREVARLQPRKATDMIRQLQQLSLLTFTSQQINVASNITRMLLEDTAQNMAAAADGLRALVTKRARRIAFTPIAARLRGGVEGVKTAGKGMVTGGAPYQNVQGEVESRAMHPFEAIRDLIRLASGDRNVLPTTERGKVSWHDVLMKVVEATPQAMMAEMQGRGLAFGDMPFSRAAQRGALAEIAKLRGLTGNAREVFLRSPDATAKRIADARAASAVFQEQGRLLGWIRAGRKSLQSTAVGDWFDALMVNPTAPFITTPLNVAKTALAYVSWEYSLGKSLYDAAQANRYAREARGTENPAKKAALEVKQSEAYRKAMMGIATAGIAWSMRAAAKALVEAGAAAGRPPEDPREKELFNASGRRANTLNVTAIRRWLETGQLTVEPGDDWRSVFPYGFFGLAVIMEARGQQIEARLSEKERAARGELLRYAFQTLPGLGNAMLETAGMRNSAGFLEALASGDPEDSQKLVSQYFRTITKMAMPNQVAQMNRARQMYWPDMKSIEWNGFRDAWNEGIPWIDWETAYPFRMDPLGMPARRTPEGVPAFVYHVLSVAKTAPTVPRSELWAEIQRVYQASGNADAIPGLQPRRIGFGKNQVEISEKDYEALVEQTGVMRQAYMKEIMAGREYQKASAPRQAAILARLWSRTSTAARKAYVARLLKAETPIALEIRAALAAERERLQSLTQ